MTYRFTCFFIAVLLFSTFLCAMDAPRPLKNIVMEFILAVPDGLEVAQECLVSELGEPFPVLEELRKLWEQRRKEAQELLHGAWADYKANYSRDAVVYHSAGENRFFDLVVECARRGAQFDKDMKNDAERWCLAHEVVHVNHPEMLQVLINEKIDWKKRNFFGQTPFFKACINGKADLVKTFLAAGAPPNGYLEEGAPGWFMGQREAVGQPPRIIGRPLHAAAQLKRISVVQALLKAGADPLCKDGLERTALTCCRDPEIRGLLEEHIEKQSDELVVMSE